jgi:hypothetical protein
MPSQQPSNTPSSSPSGKPSLSASASASPSESPRLLLDACISSGPYFCEDGGSDGKISAIPDFIGGYVAYEEITSDATSPG